MGRKAMARWVPGLIAATSIGCARWTTDDGQIWLDAPDLRAGRWEVVTAESAFLSGTRICATLRCGDRCEETTLDVGSCFESGIDGPAQLDPEGCLLTGDAGVVDWTFVKIPCALDEAGFEAADDRTRVHVVTADEIEPVVEAWPERWAERDDLRLEGAAAELPRPGDPVQILTESEVHLGVILVHPEYDGPVVYERDVGIASIETLAGREAIAIPGESGDVTFVGFSDTAARLRFAHPSLGTRTVADIRVLSPDAIHSIALAVAYTVNDHGKKIEPVGARAVALDRRGAPIFGVPVTWEVTSGRLTLLPEDDLPGFDYARLGGNCERPPPDGPPVARRAELKVSFESQSADLVLRWSQPADDAWRPPDDCIGPPSRGCAITRPAPAGMAWWVLALGGLPRARRRRR